MASTKLLEENASLKCLLLEKEKQIEELQHLVSAQENMLNKRYTKIGSAPRENPITTGTASIDMTFSGDDDITLIDKILKDEDSATEQFDEERVANTCWRIAKPNGESCIRKVDFAISFYHSIDQSGIEASSSKGDKRQH